jgi:hypothetical protein
VERLRSREETADNKEVEKWLKVELKWDDKKTNKTVLQSRQN